ncbi:hypothetical protein BDC45DRAFT_127784 [Circinella umbellata]|nr:hypothetical protein BDC45DRAFT_127784 [Circinella umbellata]
MSRKRRPSDASLPEYHHNRRFTELSIPATLQHRQQQPEPIILQQQEQDEDEDEKEQKPLQLVRQSSIAANKTSQQTEHQQQQQQRARELLTDEERRANHIASEQKRRNTIRNGFKELTDIIPTLKNINNSKSTILFKAVEYVRHLEKRNRGLREKLASLQLRLEVEGRMVMNRASFYRHSNGSSSSTASNAHHSRSHHQMAPETLAALMAHKNQQKQLEMLQHQLRLQQELLTKHNIKYPQPSTSHSISTASALVVPADLRRHGALDAPSFIIPADEEYGNETAQRERLLKLHPFYHQKSSPASIPSSAYRH